MNDLGRVAAYWRQAAELEHAREGEEKQRPHMTVTVDQESGVRVKSGV